VNKDYEYIIEFKKGVCGIFAATRPQFDDRLSFGTLAFPKRIRTSQADILRVIDLLTTECCYVKRPLHASDNDDDDTA